MFNFKNIKEITLLTDKEAKQLPAKVFYACGDTVFWMNTEAGPAPSDPSGGMYTYDCTIRHAVRPVLVVDFGVEMNAGDTVEDFLGEDWDVVSANGTVAKILCADTIGASCFNNLPRDLYDREGNIKACYKNLRFRDFEGSEIQSVLDDWLDSKIAGCIEDYEDDVAFYTGKLA